MISLKHKSAAALFIAAPIVIFLFAFAITASAQNPFDIEFPVPELGNCSSFEDCRTYCESPSNFESCGRWANEQGLVGGGATEVPPEGGPGGCLSDNECREYCESDENADECLDFAVKNGHMSAEEAAQIQKQRSQGGPGGCRGREECNTFCQNPENRTTCFDFAVAQGHISQEEAERIRPFLEGDLPGLPRPGEFGPQAGRGPRGPGEPRINEQKAAQVLEELGGGPGGCTGFRECETFCSTPGNEETCFNFAIEHGLMDPQEAEKFKKIMNTEGPGGCRGRECESYCEAPGHEKECLTFAHEQGFIGDEEFEEASRFVNVIEERGGPGGCRGRECEKFCNDPANRETCFEFAKSNNLLPPGELERIEKFKALDKKVQDQGGPGGCRGEGECRSYCTDSAHFDECAAFAVNEGFLKPEDAEQSLRQFIEIEEFGPPGRQQGFPGRGFGPGGQGMPGGFPGGQQPGFGPGSEGGFPPGFENIPPEFRGQAEEQFKSRFQQFEQFRGQFERGEIPQRPPEGFRGAPPEGREGGFPGGGFFDRFRRGGDETGGGAPTSETRVSVEQLSGSGNFKFSIKDSDGVASFAFDPSSGSRFSGDVPGCPSEYKSDSTVFAQMQLPITATIVDCEGNEFSAPISSFKGGFDSSRPDSSQSGFPGQGEFPPPGEFPGRGEFPQGEGNFPPPQMFPGQGEHRDGEGFRGEQGEFIPPMPFQGQVPPNGMMPPQGEFPQSFGSEFQRQFEERAGQQFQQEVQNQVQQEFQRQFEQQSGGPVPSNVEGFVPPPGSFPPPPSGSFDGGTSGSFPPPPSGDFVQPSGSFDGSFGSVPPPPSGDFQQPAPTGEMMQFLPPPPTGDFQQSPPPPSGDTTQPPPPPPTSFRGIQNFFANILSVFNPAFR